jgi:hypothetical protein
MTGEERNPIYALRQAGKRNNEIARITGRDKGTVSPAGLFAGESGPWMRLFRNAYAFVAK